MYEQYNSNAGTLLCRVARIDDRNNISSVQLSKVNIMQDYSQFEVNNCLFCCSTIHLFHNKIRGQIDSSETKKGLG